MIKKILLTLLLLLVAVTGMAYTGSKSATLYGSSLSDPKSEQWQYLDAYDYLIVSPRVLLRIEERRPDLLGKCVVYLDFFSSPREHADPLYDVLSCPGDVWPDRQIYMKHRGGESYLYYISWEWTAIFLSEVNSFLYEHDGQLAGLFLDEWTVSHTWWQIPDDVRQATQVSSSEQRRMMAIVEHTLSLYVKKYTTKSILVANGERISLTPPDLRVYCESVGSSWQPWNIVIPKSVAGDFWQVNSSDKTTRVIATYMAAQMQLSLGMQPREGVLAYDTLEDPKTWP